MQDPEARHERMTSLLRIRKIVQVCLVQLQRKMKGQNRKIKSFHFDLSKYLYSRVLCVLCQVLQSHLVREQP